MKCVVCGITKALLIIGALNWGLVGFFNYNLVAMLFGGSEMATAARVVFSLVGIAGVLALVCMVRKCCCCGGKCKK